MDALVFFALFVAALVLFIAWSSRQPRRRDSVLFRAAQQPMPEASASPAPPSSPPLVVPDLSAQLEGIGFADDGEVLMTDDKFGALVTKRYGDRLEGSFFTTIAGVSHLNDDRTSRKAAIRKCDPLDVLHLFHDADNQFSKHAVQVVTEEWKQLGYLPDRVGAEVVAALAKGTEVIGLFRHRNHHPETDKVVGGTIAVLYLRRNVC